MALVTILALAAGAAAASATAPALRLTGLAPLTVRGTSFRPDETVRVRVVARTRATVSARADAGGAFVAVFPRSIVIGHCSGLFISAVGSAGSTAMLKRPMLPACMPDRSSG